MKKTVKKTSKVRKPVPKSKVQSPKSQVTPDIHMTGVPMVVEKTDPAMVIEWPRTIVHHHTYGLLSPFFEGLKKGVLRGVVVQTLAAKRRASGCRRAPTARTATPV